MKYLYCLPASLESDQGKTKNILVSSKDEATDRTQGISSFSQGNVVPFGCPVLQNTWSVSNSWPYQNGAKKGEMGTGSSKNHLYWAHRVLYAPK